MKHQGLKKTTLHNKINNPKVRAFCEHPFGADELQCGQLGATGQRLQAVVAEVAAAAAAA
eukprot:CAMPEP_0194560644 /NCGR_PEP_ID=MMETSP0292-20121207/1735_1 /TAXON_ID=39354 /ORGANISM="Heterosigma akashiwo, Strain CCMP2393" /LENGTH=59 /DNA_ID=CAMNT_0039408851 /DNA_START=447 /DNA_END=622 /DNA_ORIENTATION=+